jgi:hypothetical protein
MTVINQTRPAGLELDAAAPALVYRQRLNERQAELQDADVAFNQSEICPLLRGILIAAIPALLLRGVIFELAARLF